MCIIIYSYNLRMSNSDKSKNILLGIIAICIRNGQKVGVVKQNFSAWPPLTLLPHRFIILVTPLIN